jgi:hypothetical protein
MYLLRWGSVGKDFIKPDLATKKSVTFYIKIFVLLFLFEDSTYSDLLQLKEKSDIYTKFG